VCLKLYRDDDLAAHLCAVRSWSGAGVQSRAYSGVLIPLLGLWSSTTRGSQCPLCNIKELDEGTCLLAEYRAKMVCLYLCQEVTQVPQTAKQRRVWARCSWALLVHPCRAQVSTWVTPLDTLNTSHGGQGGSGIKLYPKRHRGRFRMVTKYPRLPCAVYIVLAVGFY